MEEQQEHVGYVYFIHAPSVGRMKIGYAGCDPDRRFAMLDVGSPVQLEKYALMRGPQSLEGELHRRFRKFRKKGEWFCAHESLLAYIRENACDWEEYTRELREAGRANVDAAAAASVAEFQRAVRRIEDHESTCYMLGLDPATATDAELKATVRPKRRRLRYGPLQEMLDKLDQPLA